MKRRGYIILGLLIISTAIHAQKTGVVYITALDTADVKHNLTFNKNGTIRISYPIGPGVYWKEIINDPKIFNYSVNHDTVSIFIEVDSIYSELNKIEKRLIDSKFIILDKKQLFDCISGYSYITRRQANRMRYGAVAFEGKVYILNKRRTRALRKVLNEYESDELTSKVTRGKSALDKYGTQGIYGVIEISKK